MLKRRLSLVLGIAALVLLAAGATVANAARHRAGANVAVRLAATPHPVSVGQNLTYTLTVRNAGPRRATNVVVRDRIPARSTFVSATASQGACAGTWLVTCRLGALPRGAAARVTIVVQPTENGRIVNQAWVRARQFDHVGWNNRASITTLVGPAVNLALALQAAPRPATVGQPLTYTLTVRNPSTLDATDVVLTNRIPARSTFVSAAASQGSCAAGTPVTCALGTLAAGASAQVTIVVQPTTAGYISDRASVKADQLDPYLANNSRSTTVRVRAGS